jgi:hypothetical protein
LAVNASGLGCSRLTLVVAAASRFLDWFWLRSTERSIREQSGQPSARTLDFIGRARLAREVAVRTERPAEPFVYGGGEAVACELYRETIHWALLAHAELTAGSGDSAPVEATTSVPALLERVDQALLADAASGKAELDALAPRLSESYREFAELAPAAQRALLAELARFASALLEPLASLEQKLERLWVRRIVHLLGALVVLLGIGLVGRAIAQSRERETDLAPRASWTASSTHAVGGCKSPLQRCAGGESYFFHTQNEPNPWILFDLGRERRISAIEVENRLDCCIERAMPLVFEVSNNREKWTEVARSTEEFTSVRKKFKSVKTRYVRLRIDHATSILHLSRVRIFP